MVLVLLILPRAIWGNISILRCVTFSSAKCSAPAATPGWEKARSRLWGFQDTFSLCKRVPCCPSLCLCVLIKPSITLPDDRCLHVQIIASMESYVLWQPESGFRRDWDNSRSEWNAQMLASLSFWLSLLQCRRYKYVQMLRRPWEMRDSTFESWGNPDFKYTFYRPIWLNCSTS